MKKQINPVVLLLAMLSGVRRDAILRAPDATGRAVTTGVIMLVTAVIAMSAMGYALQRAFIGETYALPIGIAGGALWGVFILGLDRLLLMGIDKTARWYHTWLQLLIRIPVAVLIGVIISKPLVLRISQTILDRELREQQMAAVDAERSAFEKEEALGGKIQTVADLQRQFAENERRLLGEPDSFEYQSAKADVESARGRYRATSSANGARISRAQGQIRTLELSNTIEDQRRLQALRGSVARWRAEISRALSDVRTAEGHLEEVANEWARTVRDKQARIDRDLNAAEIAKAQAVTTVETLTKDSNEKLEELMRTNLVNEYTTLEHIKNTPSHRNAKTIARIEFGLDLLFIVVEIAPLFSKVFSRINALDRAVAAVEEEDENRITHALNTSFAQSQKLFEVGLTLYDDATEQWADAKRQLLQQMPNLTEQALKELREELARLAA